MIAAHPQPEGRGLEPFSPGEEFSCSPFLAVLTSSHNPDAQINCEPTKGVRRSADKVQFLVQTITLPSPWDRWDRLQHQLESTPRAAGALMMTVPLRGNFTIRWQLTDTLMLTGSSGHPECKTQWCLDELSRVENKHDTKKIIDMMKCKAKKRKVNRGWTPCLERQQHPFTSRCTRLTPPPFHPVNLLQQLQWESLGAHLQRSNGHC